MKKYRRIEVNAFRRRVTVVSGEWPREGIDAAPAQADNEVSLNQFDQCEPVEPDSPEGQLILAEAVRTLEGRLSPEARALITKERISFAPDSPRRNRLYSRLQSLFQFIWSKAFRFAR